MRFVSVLLISLLLLSPILKKSKQETKKPIVVVAQDQSLSIGSETDSLQLAIYHTDLSSMIQSLGQDHDVRSISFGEEVREGIDGRYDDRSSNLSSVLTHIGDLYGDQNLGAVIYATDGIYNEGLDPLYSNYRFSAPIFTVALGDTTQDKDLYIRQVFHNNISYLGDKTTLQIDVSCFNGNGQGSSLKVYHMDGDRKELLETVVFRIDQSDFFRTLEVTMPQEHTGLQRFRVTLDGLRGEKSYANNSRDFFIDVIDARQKVLILAGSPHPDVGAIRSALEKNKNYEVVTSLAKDFDGEIKDFDLAILHQLPTKRNQERRLLRQIKEMKMPTLMVVGAQTNLSLFNQYQNLINIAPKGINSNLVQGVIQDGFSLFTFSDELLNQLGSFAPIDAPFAEFKVNPAAQVFMKQRIGKVDTDFPLWIFGEDGDKKESIIVAEGLWRWGLYDYLQNESHQVFDEIIGKTAQYISLKEDKRKFRVFQVKNLLAENEDALFDAELYNQSYELINDPEVTMNINNAQGETFTFVFTKQNKSYTLDAGKLPVGDYSWSAQTQYEGERFDAQGQFSVKAIAKENYATVANHNLLRQLSNASGGLLFYPNQLQEVSSTIEGSDELKPILYRVFETENAISLRWIFFILLGLLSAEWGLRRYMGGY
ncbi:MAG: hypothetical protein HKN87_13390 [Saprospiraceae bacterium]|nr:hypothetical protein [Saprospiraceae bacterium]